MGEATTQPKTDYFRMPRPLWRKLKKYLPKRNKNNGRGGRPRASDRAVANARWAKKAENWLALVQLACAHILLNLAVFG